MQKKLNSLNVSIYEQTKYNVVILNFYFILHAWPYLINSSNHFIQRNGPSLTEGDAHVVMLTLLVGGALRDLLHLVRLRDRSVPGDATTKLTSVSLPH